MPIDALPTEALYTACDPKALGFRTTEEVANLDGVLGQDRALEAIHFGTQIEQPGYNLFVLGPPGTGKHSTVTKLLQDKAKQEPPPPDWVYVNNFEAPHKPNAIHLPAGVGNAFAVAMRQLIEDIRNAIPAAFESEDYQKRRQAIDEGFQERQEKAFQALRERAKQKNIALVRTPLGFGLAPIRGGEVVRPDVFEKLPQAEREQIQADIEELQAELEAIIKQLPRLEKERRDAVRDLNREVTAFAIGQPIEELRQRFAGEAEIVAHLKAVEADLVENFHTLQGMESGEGQGVPGMPPAARARFDGFRRYEVNPIVSRSPEDTAPVVYEDNPTLPNLIGRVEYLSQLGALVTDFTLIKPGALHRANGGYLILDARNLLLNSMAWEALKRVLRARRIGIESLGQMLGLTSTVSLEPEPIPLRVKVVLCGEPLLYYLLSRFDPEFAELFKVAADFDDAMDRDGDGTASYARLIAGMVRRDGLKPFASDAVARVIEHSARMAGDAAKVCIRLEPIGDLLREADYFAGAAADGTVTAAHVQQALDAQVRRADRLRERSYEMITRNIMLIDTAGARVGQINGLSVIELGGFAFGRPTRITARVRMGAGKVVDIEREVELGGPLHSKGVLILSGFIAARYAPTQPLSLSASLVFEQSYGGVEGDSASSAELYVLLSALAEAPVRQDLAVTGSVNQHGEVQAIGGVNEKIEGFFDICEARGLTGDQGVLIPAANVTHLMLRRDVIDAVAAGKFHIYPVETIDQGIALLTGIEAGARGADGAYPEASLNRRVEDRLIAFATARRAFARHAEEEGRNP